MLLGRRVPVDHLPAPLEHDLGRFVRVHQRHPGHLPGSAVASTGSAGSVHNSTTRHQPPSAVTPSEPGRRAWSGTRS
jgi:hypothetical protein